VPLCLFFWVPDSGEEKEKIHFYSKEGESDFFRAKNHATLIKRGFFISG